MAIRKSMEELVRVDGDCNLWMTKVQEALVIGRFTKIKCNEILHQVTANYKKFATWGEICITLISVESSKTDIHIKTTANMDNIYALFKSPNKTIMDAFKMSIK